MAATRSTALVMALVLAGAACGDDRSSADDLIAWCRAATTIVAHADVVGPEFDGDAASAAANLDRALADALEVAPESALPDLARFRDLIVLFGEELTRAPDRDAARDAAWSGTDRVRLAESIDSLDAQISADCDVSLAGAVGPPLLDR